MKESVKIKHNSGSISEIIPELSIELFGVRCHFYKYYELDDDGLKHERNYYIGCANSKNGDHSTLGYYGLYVHCKTIALAIDKAKELIQEVGVEKFRELTGFKKESVT